MKTCEAFAALLDLFVDGELSAEELVRVQTHLDTCPGCRAYVDDALAIRAAFPNAEETAVPAGFADGVMAAVRVTPQTKRKAPWARVLAPLAACLAVVIVLQSGPLAGGGGSAAPQAADAAYDTGVPEAAMAVEDAVPGEAPAAFLMEGADGGEAMTENAPAQDVADAKTAVRYTGVSPFAKLTLTVSQVGEALADRAPDSITEEGIRSYCLTVSEYDALRTALADSGIQFPDIPESDDTFALVTVTP